MKIVLAALPPQQSSEIVRRYKGHDIRVLGPKDTESLYADRAVDCDLCIVNVKLISHKKLGILRLIKAGHRAYVSGLSTAINAIEERQHDIEYA